MASASDAGSKDVAEGSGPPNATAKHNAVASVKGKIGQLSVKAKPSSPSGERSSTSRVAKPAGSPASAKRPASTPKRPPSPKAGAKRTGSPASAKRPASTPKRPPSPKAGAKRIAASPKDAVPVKKASVPSKVQPPSPRTAGAKNTATKSQASSAPDGVAAKSKAQAQAAARLKLQNSLKANIEPKAVIRKETKSAELKEFKVLEAQASAATDVAELTARVAAELERQEVGTVSIEGHRKLTQMAAADDDIEVVEPEIVVSEEHGSERADSCTVQDVGIDTLGSQPFLSNEGNRGSLPGQSKVIPFASAQEIIENECTDFVREEFEPSTQQAAGRSLHEPDSDLATESQYISLHNDASAPCSEPSGGRQSPTRSSAAGTKPSRPPELNMEPEAPQATYPPRIFGAPKESDSIEEPKPPTRIFGAPPEIKTDPAKTEAAPRQRSSQNRAGSAPRASTPRASTGRSNSAISSPKGAPQALGPAGNATASGSKANGLQDKSQVAPPKQRSSVPAEDDDDLARQRAQRYLNLQRSKGSTRQSDAKQPERNSTKRQSPSTVKEPIIVEAPTPATQDVLPAGTAYEDVSALGPGGSQVVFEPTRLSQRLFVDLTGEENHVQHDRLVEDKVEIQGRIAALKDPLQPERQEKRDATGVGPLETNGSDKDTRREVETLREAVAEMRHQLQRARQQTSQLEQQCERYQSQVAEILRADVVDAELMRAASRSPPPRACSDFINGLRHGLPCYIGAPGYPAIAPQPIGALGYANLPQRSPSPVRSLSQPRSACDGRGISLPSPRIVTIQSAMVAPLAFSAALQGGHYSSPRCNNQQHAQRPATVRRLGP